MAMLGSATAPVLAPIHTHLRQGHYIPPSHAIRYWLRSASLQASGTIAIWHDYLIIHV